MARAFVFPGQGAQAVGMGRDLAEAFPVARAIFDQIDEALGQPLSKLMFEGPEATLTLTENAQPALMAASLAATRVLESEGGFTLADKGAFVAGHSLGEYSALAAAGALDVADAARLLRLRGQAMQQAVPVGAGAMAALMGLELEAVREVAAEASEAGVCDTANDNAPGQVVISGDVAAVERAVELAKARGAKRAVMLSVSAPFHCRLMQPAAEVMQGALADTKVSAPTLPLVANVTASPLSDPDAIRQRLIEQVTQTVRWRESVQYMAGSGVTTLVELGQGKVLSGLARRIDRALSATSVGTSADIESAVATLSEA